MESLWTQEIKLSHRPSYSGRLSTPVAIIGGGLAGILTAYFLKQQGISSIILEAKSIGSGQTGRSTAKVTSQHGLIYHRLLTEWGFEKAKLYAEANQWAIEEYERIIRDWKINCSWRREDAYLYSYRQEKLLNTEAQAAQLLGLPASIETRSGKEHIWEKSALFLLRFSKQASFQPLTFLKNVAKDLTIYENSPVLSVHDHVLNTPQSFIQADHIVFATHYPMINCPGFHFTKLHQERSYLLALKNAPVPSGMYLGIDSGKYTFRTHGDITIFGGSGRRTGQSESVSPYDQLKEKAHSLWPDCEIISAWSAQDCMSLDQIPYVGSYSTYRPYWYLATGFNKWGITSSMVAAKLLSDQICGIANPWASVFRPGRRITPSAAKTRLSEFGVTASNWTRGILTSRRCPHLGCRLEWNRFEKTWECPCHGSRFEENGELLDNPAKKNKKLTSQNNSSHSK